MLHALPHFLSVLNYVKVMQIILSGGYLGRFSFSLNYRKFRLEIKWNDHFGSHRPEYLEPPWKVVHFDRSGHFGRSDRNVLFHLTQSLSPELLLCILLTRTITKHALAWVGSVQPQCTVPFNMWNFRDFKPKWKAPLDSVTMWGMKLT